MSGRLAILAGIRTPFARAGGALAAFHAEELGALAAGELLLRTGFDPALIDEVILGSVGQGSRAPNLARVVALLAGVPESVPAVTVNRNCGSGFQALTTAMDRMLAGRGEIFLVGGAESMSNYPLEYGPGMRRLFLRLMKARSLPARLRALLGFRLRHLRPRVALEEGLRDPVAGLSMGETAEVLAREFRISRESQDDLALESHRRAAAAAAKLREETFDLVPPDGGGGTPVVRDDTGVRPGQSIEALAKLRPYFDRRHGSVTVGNSCQVTDGAVACLVASEERAAALGLKPLGFLADHAWAGLSPRRMGLGPVLAMARLLARGGLTVGDIDLFEINEAFAAQVLACLAAAASPAFCTTEADLAAPLGRIPRDRLNVNGGAIALGHPVGASGARLVLTLLHELARRGLRSGVAALCVGGGQGGALRLDRT